MPEISIVIVTWNSELFIEDCLKSVLKQIYKDWELIIVDNGSSDGTVDYIKRIYPEVILIRNQNNLGFCQANNQGINLAKGRYIFVLNSDVILGDNFLGQMKTALDDSEKAIGMAGPKIMQSDGKTIYSTGLLISRSRRFYNRGEGEIDKKQYDTELNILGCCAASVIYKREMLEDIKLLNEYFDEDFFFLLEDVDLSLRAHSSGWKALFVPEAVCYHQGNSSGYKNEFRQYLSFRNRYFLIVKNDTLTGLLKDAPYIITYDSLRFFYVLFFNRYFLKALREIFSSMPGLFKKHLLIKERIKNMKMNQESIHV